jgi:hypothetical protein
MAGSRGVDHSADPGEGVTESAERRAGRLRERVYVTFTALAVILALNSHAGEVSVRGAALTLAITVLGTVTAAFTAELISHVVTHATLPDRDELRYLATTCLQALTVIVLPLAFLGLAGIGSWELHRSLRAGSTVLIVTLAAIGYLGVRRARIAPWQKFLLLLVLVALGLLVVVLELLAHG